MKTKLILAIIILAAGILRLYKLSSYPVSLSWDEVAIGYNAYSIAQTGTDEYGHRWPILFQSFNDYKLPGYIYVDALLIKFFGLSEFTTRAPSALLGIIAVVTLYFLTKKLFEENQDGWQSWKESRRRAASNFFLKSETIALLAAFFLAISPWHLQLSRAAFESNAALTIVLVGVTLLLYGPKNKLASFLSVPILSVSLYFYYSPRIVVPAILLAFILIFKEKIIANLKFYLAGTILAILLTIPIITQVFSPQGFKRIGEVSIFADKSLIVNYVDARAQSTSPIAKIFLNRRIPIVFESLHNYFVHFSPGFLFFGDDPNPRHRSSFHGNFYLFEIPLILTGLWFILKTKDKRLKYFLLAWILAAPLPAALSQEAPHGLRSLNLLPPLAILSAVGFNALQNSRFKLTMTLAAAVLFINYLVGYYQVYPRQHSLAWAYGYRQMIGQIQKIESQYDRIIITGHYWKPYIFYLFYNAVSPKYYQAISTQESIGIYRFGTTYWDSGGKDLDEEDIEKLKGSKTLLVISPNEFANLKNQDRFIKLADISDYSDKNVIFEIGEWR